ncbi:hypothetical protein ACFV08_27775, partial [Streptomyces fradiae]
MTEQDVDEVDEALALVGPPPAGRAASHPPGHRDTPWERARAPAAPAGRAPPARPPPAGGGRAGGAGRAEPRAAPPAP